MTKNLYYLVVGILSVLFAFTHAINGHNQALPALNESALQIFYPVWHIITVENLIFGTAFLYMSFQRQPSKTISLAWLYLIILLARWVVLTGSSLYLRNSSIHELLIDSIAIFVGSGLILLGIRRSGRV